MIPRRWAMSTPRQVTPKHNPYEYVPDSMLAADGSIIIAHNSAATHQAPGGRDAILRRSTDLGATWQTVLKMDGPPGQLWATEGMVHLLGGTLLALMSRSVTHDQIEFVRMFVSDDNGETWRAWGPDYPWTQAATFGNLVELSDGSLLVPWHGTGWGMASFDVSGLNGTIWDTSNGGRWMMEGRLLPLEGGNVLGMGRQNGAGFGEGLSLFKSTDYGETWGQGVSTGLLDLSEGFTVVDNRLVMVTIHRPTGLMELREGLIGVNDPVHETLWGDPTAWSTPLYLTTLLGPVLWDRGYPDLITLPNGDIHLTYYAGHKRPSIHTAILSLTAEGVRAADRLAIRRQGFDGPSSDKTVTGTTAPGLSLHARNVPIYEEMGQRGKAYLRINARVKGTPGSTIRLTLGAQGGPLVVPVVSIDVPIPTTGEYPGDSGWVEVPADYTAGSTDRLGQYSQLTFRGYIVDGDGPVTVMEASTYEIGAQE